MTFSRCAGPIRRRWATLEPRSLWRSEPSQPSNERSPARRGQPWPWPANSTVHPRSGVGNAMIFGNQACRTSVCSPATLSIRRRGACGFSSSYPEGGLHGPKVVRGEQGRPCFRQTSLWSEVRPRCESTAPDGGCGSQGRLGAIPGRVSSDGWEYKRPYTGADVN